MDNHDYLATSIQWRPSMKRRLLNLSQEGLIEITSMNSETRLPIVARPVVDGVELDIWIDHNRSLVESLLLEYRAILFRNFDISSTESFDRLIRSSSNGQLLEYKDRSSPRHEVGAKIYTSTDYPADQSIFLHNEGTYWLTWPLKIYFCCLEPAESGGETPIADVRNVYQRIDPQIRERFTEKSVLYVRNYNDGFGLPWQEVFQTTDKAAVVEHCRRHAIECCWKSGDRLRTRQVRQAVAIHPMTGEFVWFNHAAFFHISMRAPAMRDALLEEFKEEDLPHNTYYGDGSPIEDSVIESLREAYLQEKTVFPWQKGDALLLDNMSVAHGREPFIGKRQVIVGMAEPFRPSDKEEYQQHGQP